MRGNFAMHMSANSPSKISLNPSEVISEVSEPYNNFLKYPTFPKKSHIVQGEGGGNLFVLVGILIFLLLTGVHAKF